MEVQAIFKVEDKFFYRSKKFQGQDCKESLKEWEKKINQYIILKPNSKTRLFNNQIELNWNYSDIGLRVNNVPIYGFDNHYYKSNYYGGKVICKFLNYFKSINLKTNIILDENIRLINLEIKKKQTKIDSENKFLTKIEKATDCSTVTKMYNAKDIIEGLKYEIEGLKALINRQKEVLQENAFEKENIRIDKILDI